MSLFTIRIGTFCNNRSERQAAAALLLLDAKKETQFSENRLFQRPSAFSFLTGVIVSVNDFGCKGGQANGDMFSPAFVRSAVLNPLPFVGDDGLPFFDVIGPLFGFHAKFP